MRTLPAHAGGQPSTGCEPSLLKSSAPDTAAPQLSAHPTGAENRPDHLLCYKIKITAGTSRFGRKDGIFATSQFGQEQLTALGLDALCVPSTKTP